MVALLTPEEAAIASTLVASIPFSANSSSAASRTLWCARWLKPRAISNLDLRKAPGSKQQQSDRDQKQSQQIGRCAEHHQPACKRSAEAVYSIREGINPRNGGPRFGGIVQRVESAGEKENRQTEKVHDELKPLHNLETQTDRPS